MNFEDRGQRSEVRSLRLKTIFLTSDFRLLTSSFSFFTFPPIITFMGKTICVIDDEPGIRSEMELWLIDHGYDVVTAESGERAIEKLKGRIPHLFILDIMMPKVDGFETLSAFQNNSQTSLVPVIMLTAKKETQSILQAQQLKARDYFFKPFDPDELLFSIKKNIL